MILRGSELLAELYEVDETAWLEAMVELIEQDRIDDLDFNHLREYLTDMARRDRREVESRLIVLLMPLLKWEFQPDHRSRNWRATIVEQRQELIRLMGTGILRNHAESVLNDVYPEAVERAVAETGMPKESFPAECPYSLDRVLSIKLSGE